MSHIRICYVLKLKTGGLWGSGKGLLEADNVTSLCRHASGLEVPCIPATYVKGLLRRSSEEVIHLLQKLDIVKDLHILEEVYGPLTPFGDEASPRPCNTYFAPLYPVRSLEQAARLARDRPLAYLHRDDVLHAPQLYGEPHVRIDDRSARASVGGLYRELRVVPGTLFYGEILHYPSNVSLSVPAARILVIAVSMLGYRYAGRKTIVAPRIISVEPKQLEKDPILRIVLEAKGLKSENRR